MIARMVVRNLAHRPIRTFLSVLAVAVEVAMILLIVGLSEGLLQESMLRTKGIGADILIRPSTSSAAMSLSTADIPEQLVQKLAEAFPEVQLATGTTVNMVEGLQSISGVEWETIQQMSGGIRYLAGGPPQGPYDAIVDDVYARQQKLEAGNTLRLLNHDFQVAGIVESGKMSRIFIPLATMQELMGWQGDLSQIFLKLEDPSKTHEVVEKIHAMLPSYPVYAMEDFLAHVTTDVRAMSSQFVNVIIGIAVIIGFIVVLLSMYTAILERTREIGILKSLGASAGYIMGIVIRETLVICAGGILVGFALSFLGETIVEARFPLITIVLFPAWMLWGALIAVVGSTLGAFYPATRAARQDPIEALSYE
jgi:putative ABC transport system permease protein